jgi:very-short-patch-repair endonuclease
MQLDEKILTVLQERNGLKTKDIVLKISQMFNETIDKREINQILYYKLKGKVFQDSKYQWTIGNGDNKKINNPKIYIDTPLTRLSSYYLECLSKDMETGIWCYASNKYGSPDYGQLEILPQFSDDTIESIYNSEDVKKAINKVKQDKNKLILQLGYPINLRKVVARSEFYVVEPILLIPFDSQSFVNGNSPALTDEMPRFNFEAIKNISGLDKNELFEEVITLSDELGLNNPPSEQPSFDEILIRLQQLRPQWNWKETIIPDSLTKKLLKDETQVGISNSAAVFFSERSKYTQGLEKELTDFKEFEASKYAVSALGQWIKRDFPQFELKEKVLVEPLPLNEEQRNAVKRSLQAPLTVVTGPPGTGKSQVVTSIIINAIYQGQTVLFASKNHKAVDVVNERVNGLTSRPVMLRLGNNELQSELAKYLSGLLSSNTSPSDYEKYEASKSRHEELTKKIDAVNLSQYELLKIRNNTDALEQSVENHRELFGSELFYGYKNFKEDKFQEIENIIKNFEETLIRADRNRQSFFTRLFWFSFRKTRVESVLTLLPKFNLLLPELKIETLQVSLSENTLQTYFGVLNQIKIHLKFIREISNYFKSLELLKKQKSLFQLAQETKITEDSISENSHDLWENWLRLLPDRLTNENRKVLGDYTALLNLIVKANANNTTLENRTFAKYYELLPKVTNILSCWAVTSLSVRGKVPFEAGFFDLVIIDEASQCDIASALPLLFRAKRAVVIGDSKQLTHISAINENQDIQLLDKYELEEDFLSWSYAGNSLFGLAQTICSSNDIVVLKDHHRSHADIINFSNKEFYDGTLRVATNYEKLKPIANEPIVRWINVLGKIESPNSGGSVNQLEASEVVKELKRIVQMGYKGTIGVVSPFRAQANRINDLVHKEQALSEQLVMRDFLADTVHRFQGDERDIMIFSPVISTGISKGSTLFLSRTGNLFNVAITRARAALIIVGDKNACSTCGIKYMERFVDYINTLKLNTTENKDMDKDLGNLYPAIPSTYSVSDWEKKLYELLYKKGIRTIPQFQVEQYALDLGLFTKVRRLDIEVDGEKYHRTWDGELCKRDQLRNKRLIELGWDVMRFWVYEIRDDIDGCVSKVQDWIDRE